MPSKTFIRLVIKALVKKNEPVCGICVAYYVLKLYLCKLGV
jgi:hypothetical protein